MSIRVVIQFVALVATLIAGATLPARLASAQNAPEPQATGLEAIIVTARRREENLQTVPISISALSGEALEQKSFASMDDLTELVPGLHFGGEGGGQHIIATLRGVTQPSVGFTSPGVVLYMSDVPMPADGSNFPNFDIENIQVLKGPQGTLFGQNAIGGAILFNPVLPNFDGLSGYLKAGAGNFKYHQVEGAVNVPIIDQMLAIRLAVQSNRRDGWVDNLAPGSGALNNMHEDSGRLSVLFEHAGVTSKLVVDYLSVKEAGIGIVPLSTSDLAGNRPAVPGFPTFEDGVGCIPLAIAAVAAHGLLPGCGPNPFVPPPFNGNFASDPAHPYPYGADMRAEAAKTAYDRTYSANPYGNRETWGVMNKTEWAVNDESTLRNIVAYRRADVTDHSNVAGMPPLDPCKISVAFCGLASATGPNGFPAAAPLSNYAAPTLSLYDTYVASRLSQTTEEFQVLGKLFHKRLDYIVGAFWGETKPTGDSGTSGRVFVYGMNPATAGPPFSLPPFNAIPGFCPGPLCIGPNGGTPTTNSGYYWTTTSAIFGQAKYDLSDWLHGLSADLGYRYTWDRYTGCGEQTPGATQANDYLSSEHCSKTPGASVTSRTSAPTWTIGLDWQATDKTFFYLTSRRGYRAGGPNTPTYTSAATTTPFGGCPGDAPGAPSCNNFKQFQTYRPEQLTDVELGMKSAWTMNGWRGLFDADVYHTWYKNTLNIANFGSVIPSGTPDRPPFGVLIVNAGDVQLTGVDLQASVLPTEHLVLTLSGNWQHQVATATPIIGFNPAVLTSPGGISPALPSPEWSYTISGMYTFPFRPWDSAIRLNVDYSDSGAWGVQGTTVPGHESLEARLSLANIRNSGLEVALFGRNLTNVHYLQVASILSPGFGFTAGAYGDPRMYGMELRYRFGK